MKINLKKNDHLNENVGLCGKCKWANIIRSADGNTLVRCSLLDLRIRRKIDECSDFREKGTLTLTQMAEMATIVTRKKNKVGFVKFSDMDDDDKKEVKEHIWEID